MLDAVCAGEVFTSPVPDQMAEATKHIDGGAGVLHLVWNYTGDVMNFDMAAELAAADSDTDGRGGRHQRRRRRRGQPLHRRPTRDRGRHRPSRRSPGPPPSRAASLPELADLARRVNDNTRSMGMALTSCTVPAKGSPTFDLPEDEIEIGIGIHGEPGRRRVPLAPARDIAAMLVEPLLADLDFTAGDGVLVFVNGMGATPMLELHLMYAEVAALLDRAGVVPVRSLVGPYVTSLDMAGCSVTLTRFDDELLRLWDAPVAALGLRWGM